MATLSILIAGVCCRHLLCLPSLRATPSRLLKMLKPCFRYSVPFSQASWHGLVQC